MPAWNPNEYETVDTRIHRFYDAYPEGRIITELVDRTADQFVVKAYVYRTPLEDVAATGYAEERVGSSPVNRTSALENCETSAVGRALANLGLSPKGSRPSTEEMEKAARHDDAQAAGFADAMRHAANVDALNKVAASIQASDLPDDRKDYLRVIFKRRAEELSA